MAIDVTCPVPHPLSSQRKIRGQVGAVPRSAKATIKVPEKKDEVVIHAPEVSGPKDSHGPGRLQADRPHRSAA